MSSRVPDLFEEVHSSFWCPVPTRKIRVRRSEKGQRLDTWLCGRLALSGQDCFQLLQEGSVRVAGEVCTDPSQLLRPDQLVTVKVPKGENPPEGEQELSQDIPPPVIRYVDEHVVVVDKPTGLTTMRHPEEAEEFGPRGQRFLPATLADILPGLLPAGHHGRPRPVRAVHRLDKETSGLVVFARTRESERHVAQQFREHRTERLYWALVRGRARAGRITSRLVRDRGDGRRGSLPTGERKEKGQQAITHVRVIEELGEYTLVECRLETGRTHQVRIHLAEAGTPLCGERVYDRPLHGRPWPDASGAPRVALHAMTLGFDHPVTGKRLRWTSPLPADLQDLLQSLRKRDSVPQPEATG